jgi:PAS domain S-box-containing protein
MEETMSDSKTLPGSIILNALSDAVIILRHDLIIEEVNNAFLSQFGTTRERIIGKPCFDTIFERLEVVQRPHSTSNPDPVAIEIGRREYLIHREGKQVWYQSDLRPLPDADGLHNRWLLIMREISEQKLLQQDLEKSQKKYKFLFENAREGLILFEDGGNILEQNFAAAFMLGYAEKELKKMKMSDLARGTSKKILAQHLRDLKTLGTVSVEMTFIKKDGTPLPLDCDITWLPEEEIYQITARDISIKKKLDASRKTYSEKLEREVRQRTWELKVQEEETHRQKRTAEGIIYGSPLPMFVIDRAHKILYWNKACEKLTGFRSAEMIGTDRHWEPFYPTKRPLLADVIVDDDPRAFRKVNRRMKLRQSPIIDGAYEAEYFVPHLGEKGTHLYISAAPIKDARGTIQAAIVTYQDISERVKMTEELQASEQETRRQKRKAEGIIHGSPIPMMVINKDHKVSYWNRACEKLTGFSSKEMVATDRQWMPFWPTKRPILADLIIDNNLADMKRLYKGSKIRKSVMVDGAYEAEHYFSHLGEKGRHLYFNAAPIRDEAGKMQGAIVTYQDFTERVVMTQEINRRDAFLQNLIHNSIDGIIATEQEGKIVIFNRGASQILGYPPERILGRMSYTELLSEEMATSIREAFYRSDYGPRGKIINMETNFIDQKNDSVPVRLSGTLLFEGRKEVGSVVFIQDMREVFKLQREKEQAERMAAIGKTVAGVAHYIKNILSGLKGGAYVINSALSKNDLELIKKGWAMVEKNIDQITLVVTDMLIYSGDRKPVHEWVSPNDLVAEVMNLMAERAKLCRVELLADLEPKLKAVAMDKTAIYRCLLNLVSNAIDACTLEGIMQGNGRVIIKTAKAAGWGVKFEVVDNGTGIPPETQQRLFTDFFTTKGYKGTGLGLPVTKKIVSEHGGQLRFESEPEKGTRFVLFLPNPGG